MNHRATYLGFITLLIASIVMLNSCTKNTANQNNIPTTGSLCQPHVTAYNFDLDHLSPNQQAQRIQGAGLAGVFLQIPPSGGVQKLREFYQTTAYKAGTFTVNNAFVYLSLTDSALKKQQLQYIEDIYSEIQFEPTQLQVIFLGPNADPTNAIAKVAGIAQSFQKDLIIYPHYQTSSIASAEDALNYINAVQKPNVFLAVHLCHELAAGNGERLDEVITNVSPYIKSVSISGATLKEFNDSTLPLWYWGIKPLFMGKYDLVPFYTALYNNNYQGDIAIQTWGIKNNFGLTPEQHLPLSKTVIDSLAVEVCK